MCFYLFWLFTVVCLLGSCCCNGINERFLAFCCMLRRLTFYHSLERNGKSIYYLGTNWILCRLTSTLLERWIGWNKALFGVPFWRGCGSNGGTRALRCIPRILFYAFFPICETDVGRTRCAIEACFHSFLTHP